MLLFATCIPDQAFSMVASNVGERKFMQATRSSHLDDHGHNDDVGGGYDAKGNDDHVGNDDVDDDVADHIDG